MADFSNPYGSAHARTQANKKTFEALERSEKKRQEEEAKKQKDLEEISRNIKRREERLRAQELGIVEHPFAVTVVPPAPEKQKAKTMRRTRTTDLRLRKKKDKEQDEQLPEEGTAMLRANMESQRKEILNLTEQLDAKTREVIALRLTLNEVKEERKKANAAGRERSLSLGGDATLPVFSSPTSPTVVPQPAQTTSPISPSMSPQMVPKDALAQKEKELQNLAFQLKLRDTAIEKLKEGLGEAKEAALQSQALVEKREEQCRLLAMKTKELLESSKAKDIEFEIQRDELQKTKSLLVSMLREKQM